MGRIVSWLFPWHPVTVSRQAVVFVGRMLQHRIPEHQKERNGSSLRSLWICHGERDEAGVERDRRKVQGGRWATTVLLARGEARRVGRDGDSNDGVVEERSGDGAQLPSGSLIVAQVKVATAGLVSQLVRQPQFSHQSAAPSDVAMGYGGW